ncbi:MAG: hypothetical protein ABIW85_07870 [Variovorax sp.]
MDGDACRLARSDRSITIRRIDAIDLAHRGIAAILSATVLGVELQQTAGAALDDGVAEIGQSARTL